MITNDEMRIYDKCIKEFGEKEVMDLFYMADSENFRLSKCAKSIGYRKIICMHHQGNVYEKIMTDTGEDWNQVNRIILRYNGIIIP